MLIQSCDKKPSELYHLMVQMIVPRPIAWILTENKSGSFNLAPFSYFNGVSSDPPILSFSVGKKKSGEKKDTWKNLERTGSFVVHIPSVPHAETVTNSADELEYGESEIEKLALEIETPAGWKLPRLKETKIAMFCDVHQVIEVGNKPQGLVLGEIKSIWLSDETAKAEGKKILIPPSQLDPLGRLGRSQYTGVEPLDGQF